MTPQEMDQKIREKFREVELKAQNASSLTEGENEFRNQVTMAYYGSFIGTLARNGRTPSETKLKKLYELLPG